MRCIRVLRTTAYGFGVGVAEIGKGKCGALSEMRG
jgi:hypothetical protein